MSIFRKKPPITKYFPENFVDLHSHLLPGIDDGPENMDKSMVLIKRLYGYGIKNFVCTPHVMEGVWANTPEIINEKLAELKNRLKEEGYNDINLKAGAEYLLDNHFDELLSKGNLLTVGQNYVLVELSYFNPPIHLHKVLFDIQIAGYQPLLAHPERYAYFHQKYEEYEKLKNVGCKFQLNLLSLSNYYGKQVQHIAFKLINDNMIDFVGSDTHNELHLNYLEKIRKPKTIDMVLHLLKNNETLL